MGPAPRRERPFGEEAAQDREDDDEDASEKGRPAPEACGAAEGAGPVGMVKKLRDSGYLTRDGRMKERKKYGQKGARRRFQFSKR